MVKKSKLDEKKLRKQIKSDLIQKHEKKSIDIKEELPEGKIFDQTPALKKYIRRVIEEKLYLHHPQFVKCANHLGEFKWLTAIEISKQHEFYPFEQSGWQKFKNKFSGKKHKRLPAFDWVAEYAKNLENEIAADIKNRLKKYEEQIIHHTENNKETRIKEIIAEEEEAFFRSHPDYRKYKNYLGETKWLTAEEFENQDEYYQEVKTPFQLFLKYSAWAAVILIIGFFIYYLEFQSNISNNGYVLIKTSDLRAHLYIDENPVLGLSSGLPVALSEGDHKITVRKAGFKTIPNLKIVKVTRGDTINIQFDLEPLENSQPAFLNIHSPFDDAKVFVDDEFFGTAVNNNFLMLDPGIHRIALKKEQYATIPDIAEVNINANDTLNLSFKFLPKKNGNEKKGTIKDGLLEITSNIHGANIYINGKDTGLKTDYIIGKISLGRHIVTVKKEGYEVYPRENEIILSERKNHVKANFTLTKTTLPVTINTTPVQGKIFIDGKEVGIGTWKGSLAKGKHKVHFGPYGFHRTPEEEVILVEDENPLEFNFKYIPNFSITFTPNGILPKDNLGSIQLGYLNNDLIFIADPNNGPKILKSAQIGDNIWQLGNASGISNPYPGNAIVFYFNIPREVDLKERISLKIWGYSTEQKYPFELVSVNRIQISINSQIIQDKYNPKYTLREASASIYETFPLANIIKHGRNSVRIATNTSNSVYYALWKIAIE